MLYTWIVPFQLPGTREGKTASNRRDWLKPVIAFLKKWCCIYCRKKRKENSLSSSSTSTAHGGDDGIQTEVSITSKVRFVLC